MQGSKTDRRTFVKTSGTLLAGSTLGFQVLTSKNQRFYNNSDTLKVGLIGCGGRGSGAALQATRADDNVLLTAMADLFPDNLQKSLENLQKENPSKVQVPKENQFLGFDAYKKLLATDVDVVILATPPCFRPGHLEAAVAAGKHIFTEKPVAVDAPGVRKVIEVANQAKAKGLALMSGFCWRHDDPKRATFSRILDGDIGDINSIYNTYNTGNVWYHEPQAGWSKFEEMMRNWIYRSWMSGDHIVEQAIHSLDMMSWAMGDVLPIKATGTGGRQSRTGEEYGNVYDHFAVTYEYPNGARGFHFSRQQEGCSRAYGLEITGTKGRCDIDVWNRHEITGKKNWKWEGEGKDMYQNEHDELFASIRSGKPFFDGVRMANSTMLAIWGRMAAYTGKTLTWDEALNSQEVLGPTLDEYHWDMTWPLAPVPQPGKTPFV
ncbi:MAG TPA: Gfo/Idh/MocA family oxidoreductase [Saprospiraceae bacterium]|mgnify:CR=1 FL=1|nr:Gfo/Idh/MocA family oxidoreductase [Saprospiraceae bacterium]MCB9270088.1 Gfo/Idh/MocA family oxidoreductase [Lewinellaceae bacterium]HPR01761.1 Gfo/Idh/MocA family oxidoreductase [Saprospiraceae bacterium]HRV87480.1 Gfo/Idh/MocA family oxidoreductase [Saprospiraceae bacterium]